MFWTNFKTISGSAYSVLAKSYVLMKIEPLLNGVTCLLACVSGCVKHSMDVDEDARMEQEIIVHKCGIQMSLFKCPFIITRADLGCDETNIEY